VIGTEMYDKAVRALALGLVDAKAEIPALMQALVGEHMHKHSLPTGFNVTEKLHTGKGDLRRALIPGKKGNIYEANIGLDFSVFKYGVDEQIIKYAAIHEYGGTITITKKMRGFFWYKYAETGDEMWRSMALTKKTVITIPKRSYIEKGFEQFDREEMQRMLNSIYTRMAVAFNTDS
jgi:phage gpG-like protein